ncbi:hypothetical protein [Liquorilactobacillus satsumensis]|uniref:Uncharacterized protein n=1 Tax=Liquorilactobacillus satsumensis DSM 16230 = JCM 12392 TaxID=1423801 RepID=A0A0R1V228_9LACO|nr:hypothetical protein [Liquorilactobacillus satsumensis]KRL99741.1 hypothetical protein FD50_GL000059 [Liquorilactobacillus satsumensis DSM 16230 = JCM 12392]
MTNSEICDKFKNKIAPSVYRPLECARKDGCKVTFKEKEYTIKLKIPSLSYNGIYFRPEDLKEETNYLIGEKRGPGLDNDFSIISGDESFVFEVKNTKKKNASMYTDKVCVQLVGGEHWIKHLSFLMGSYKDQNFKKICKNYCIYINLTQRVIASRIRGFDSNYCMYVKKHNDINYVLVDKVSSCGIDLTKVFHFIIKKKAALQRNLWK